MRIFKLNNILLCLFLLTVFSLIGLKFFDFKNFSHSDSQPPKKINPIQNNNKKILEELERLEIKLDTPIKTENFINTTKTIEFSKEQIEKFKQKGCDLFKNKDSKWQVRIKDFSIILNDASDVCIFEESFLGKEYDFHSNDTYVCFDIGCNTGIISLFYSLDDKIDTIYSFEPFSENLKRAQKNFNLNKKIAEKIHLFPFGLSNRDDEINGEFVSNWSGGSSARPKENKRSDHNNKEIISQKVTLKQASNILPALFEKHEKENKKIVLKIDCEGAEHEIIPNLDDCEFLKKISVICMELHPYSNDKQKPYGDILNILKKNGFKIIIKKGDILSNQFVFVNAIK